MATIDDVLKKFQKLDLYKEALEVVKSSSNKILDLNKSQLFKGLRADGTKIGRYSKKNSKYAIKKHKRNPAPGLGWVDLFDEGNFYKKTKLRIVGNKEYEIISTDVKAKDIEARWSDTIYGENSIWGLTEDNQEKAIDEFLQEKIVERVGNKLEL